ncbi:MAG: hypothetical protein M3Y72_06695 [Acidobacteriota bacterium]|nr:hypothetical protein [Acidobacteriota bacterium]
MRDSETDEGQSEVAGTTVASDVIPDEEQPSSLPYLVVGIGASAGGLQAFKDLLGAIPPKTGMAFVVISHVPRGRKSYLADILSRATLMPVLDIEDRMPVEPNKVFVIPPDAQILLEGGMLRLQDRPPRDVRPRPIDVFFRSLAAEQKNRAIGVVLSGTDSDGALGLKTLKAEGGFAIVQDERTARFEEMPRNAINADHVDLILAPDEIGRELGRIADEFAYPHRKPLDGHAPDSGDLAELDTIYAVLQSASGIDFAKYKQKTLLRRVARRMVLKRIDTLADYNRLVHDEPREANDLYEEMLIGVTRFFRDPEVWQTLRQHVLPKLLGERMPETPFRVWIPGCASGEEVYSLAICLVECLGDLPIQIFGTDVSERAIEKSRLAIYPEALVNDIEPERLRRFFSKRESGYQVTKRVRDLCVFARHNLGQHPPFHGWIL